MQGVRVWKGFQRGRAWCRAWEVQGAGNGKCRAWEAQRVGGEGGRRGMVSRALHPSGAHRNVNKTTTNFLEVQAATTTIYSPLQSAYTTYTTYPTAMTELATA